MNSEAISGTTRRLTNGFTIQSPRLQNAVPLDIKQPAVRIRVDYVNADVISAT